MSRPMPLSVVLLPLLFVVAVISAACGGDRAEAVSPVAGADASRAEAAPGVGLVPQPVEVVKVRALIDEPVVEAPARKQREVRKEARKEAEGHSALAVVDSAVATGVVKRVPQGADDTFEANVGTLWGYIKVKNTEAPSQVTMVWKREGKVRTKIDVSVGVSPGWRTWSRQQIRPRDAGRWTVETFAADGTLLDSMAFDVLPVLGDEPAQEQAPVEQGPRATDEVGPFEEVVGC